MLERHPSGRLIVVEGIDGAGKSSVLPALAEQCTALGREYVLSREPTNGPWGAKLRASALEGRLTLEEELDLFIKDRREHVEQVIAPALQAGKIVLLDRYFFSTAAYQGARGADPQAILAANRTFAPEPDLVLLLDLTPARALSRVRGRGSEDAFEEETSLARVREIFLSLVEKNWVVIDADRSPEIVRDDCAATLSRLLSEPLPDL